MSQRVPNEHLRDRAVVEDYGGAGALGPIYGSPRTVRASIQPTSRLLADSRGQTVTVEALAIIRPEAGPVRPESRATARGTAYRVVQCYPMPDERRPDHYELALARYAGPLSAAGSGSGGSGS